MERRRLHAQVESLARLRERSQREGADGERVDAEALRPGALELWPRWLKELDMVDSWLVVLRDLAEGGA